MKKVIIHKVGIKPDRQSLKFALEELLSPLGGMGKYVKPGDKVMLKPNVGFTISPETGKVTDPEVVYAVAESAIAAGASEIWIAESSIVGTDTGEAFETAGYGIFSDKEKVCLIDLKKEATRAFRHPEASCMETLYFFERVFKADVLIDIASMKTIMSSVISMGMKNLKGLIRDDTKKQCHYNNLNEAIVDINRCVKPNLTIIDGLIGCSLFDPIEHGILLAGEDIVAVDTVAAICAGVDPKTVKYLCIAEEAGLGVMDMNEIEILGERPEDVMKKYRRSHDDVSAFSTLYPEIEVVTGDACTGCVTVLEQTLRTGKSEGWLKPWEGKLRFAIGKGAVFEDDDRLMVCIGNCLKSRAGENFIQGCPFLANDVKGLLKY